MTDINLSITEYAQMFEVSPHSVYSKVTDGELRAEKWGNRWMIQVDETKVPLESVEADPIIEKLENKNLNNTAIVLGDEKLLTPLLNSIPNKIEDLNITMGLPIKLSSTASLFDNLLKLHSENKKSFYYKI